MCGVVCVCGVWCVGVCVCVCVVCVCVCVCTRGVIKKYCDFFGCSSKQNFMLMRCSWSMIYAHFTTHLLSTVAHNRLTPPDKLKLVTIVIKVRRAASGTDDLCLSVRTHSAAAFTVLFDHSGIYIYIYKGNFNMYGYEIENKRRP